MNTRSLGFRLVIWYAGLLIVVFVLFGASMYAAVGKYLEANLRGNQARRAQQIAGTLLRGIARSSEVAIGSAVEALYAPEANDRFIRITRGDGPILYVSGEPHDHSFDSTAVPPLPAVPATHSWRDVHLPGGASLVIAAVTHRAASGTRYVVEVGLATGRNEEMLERLLFLLSIGLPIAVLIAVAGGFFLVKRALEPVDRIAQKAEAITQHNLSERLPVTESGDEVERLSLALNRMISRLEEAVQSSKRLVADASHELRTPLTVLRGELEGMTANLQPASHLRETLGSLLEEVERLAAVVEGLLALSRLDAGEARAEWVKFDLAELVATTTDQMSLLAEDKGITLVCDAPHRVVVEGDRARLKQLTVNLLDNAIKYTPNGGTVRLLVARQNGRAALEVSDTGIGIPPDALPHVFERFFRVERSRSREQGGAGLGLSIVKSICTAHGAVVDVESTPEKGSRFCVRLPLAAPEPERPVQPQRATAT